MGKNKKINISIVIISGLITFLQTLIISISSINQNVIFQIIVAVLSAIVVSLEGVQMNLKRIKSRRSSINSSFNIDITGVKVEGVEQASKNNT